VVYPPAGSRPRQGDEHPAYTPHGLWHSFCTVPAEASLCHVLSADVNKALQLHCRLRPRLLTHAKQRNQYAAARACVNHATCDSTGRTVCITTRSSTRSLRSSSAPLLHVPFRRTSFGKRSFSTAALSVRNSLPVFVQNCDKLTLFKSRLKAHLFSFVNAS